MIKFSSKDIEKCQTFAKSIDTSFYASRNQSNNEKRIKDQYVGKLGEIAVFIYFKENCIEVSEPDFKIYEKSKKSWDYDLKGKDINIHVKTQNVEQGKKFGGSFIFEKSDRLIFKDHKENDYVCFVSIDLKENVAEIKSILSLKTLHGLNLFKKPKLDYLISKCAIYFSDIRNLKWSLTI